MLIEQRLFMYMKKSVLNDISNKKKDLAFNASN